MWDRCRARGVVAALAGLMILAGCSSPATVERGPQPITGWSVADDVLHLWVDTCNGDPEVDVVETAQEVTVTVVSTRQNPGDACLDDVSVRLEEPLGDRGLIDGATGRAPEPMEG